MTHAQQLTDYLYLVFVAVFVDGCACEEGWLLGKADFCDIYMHYQYADYAKPQYQRNMAPS